MSKAAILIVEDEGLVAEDLAGKLRRLGYEVAGITSEGEEAVAIVAHVRPDLVLMDISLGGPMDGIQAAEEIRRQFDVPVIYLTAHSDPGTLARAKITDPYGYILKPFEERELATQIELARYKHQADREIRQQREWLRVTLSSIGDAVIVTDIEGRVTFMNGEAERLTGWTMADATGQLLPVVFCIVNEETRQPVESPVAKVVRLGSVVGLANHTVLLAKDGREIPIDDSGAPIRQTDGMVQGVVLVFRDVTERRKVELQVSRLAAVVESSEDAILSKDLDGTILTWNATAERLFGYRADEIIGKPVWLLLPPERADEEDRILQQLQQGRRIEHFETVRLRKDGGQVHVSVSSSPIKDRQGRIVGASKIVHDISDRKRAEETLRESERRYRELVQNANSAIIRWSRVGTITFFNEYAQAFFGYSADEVVGQHVGILVPERESTGGDLTGLVQDVVDHPDRYVNNVNENVCRDGRRVWMSWTNRAIRDADGPVVEILAIGSDITDLKRAEEALQASEQRFRNVFDHAATGIAITDCDGRFVQCNAAYCRLTGFSQAELAAMEFPALIQPEDREHNMGFIRQLLHGELPSFEIENHYVHKDGSLVWVHKHVSLLHDDRGQPTHIVALVTDMTERKRIEDVFRFLAQCGVGGSGKGFFQDLARYLAQALDMDFVCIDRLEESLLSAQTVAVFHNGQFEDNVSYALRDTPCGDVVGQRICCFPRNVRGLFPKDAVLQDLQAESYLGTTLWSAQGKPIGLIAVIGRQPLANTRLAESVLQMVAVRAAGELERQQAEEALHESETLLRTVTENSPDPIFLKDRDSRILLANAATCAVMGKPADQIIGKTDIEVYADPALGRAVMENDARVMESRQTLVIEEVVPGPDGPRTYLSTKTPYRDRDGCVIGIVGVARDITARKRAEEALRKSEQEFRALAESVPQIV